MLRRSDSETGSQCPAGAHTEPEHRVALYERFTERVREIFDTGQGKDKKAVERAWVA